jgi:transcriptional regulator with XRE-family HTH domain
MRGWTQEELAEHIGTTSVTVSRWESGVTSPNRYFQKQLSDIYDKSIQELGLLQIEDSKPPVNARASPNGQNEAIAVGAVRTKSVFFFNEPLRDPAEFYGRRRERHTLINRTYNKASTSIIGPRRVGKTWLVDYLTLMASTELGSRFHIGYLDATMPSCQTVPGFVATALDVLRLSAGSKSEGLLSLEKGLKVLSAKGRVPVLCIDEFEGLSNRQEFTLDFFRGLRAMAHTFGLALVVISKLPLRNVVGKDVETSGFFNIFEQLTLEHFDADEAKRFIEEKSAQASFTPLETEYLWKYGEESQGEWPVLRLQLVGKMLEEDKDWPRGDPGYWEKFEQRLLNRYRGVVY